MTDPLFWHRLQFGFTVTYHYLFPQLTMGLALFIVLFKWFALRTNDAYWNAAAAFWARIFALNFAVGVVTGIPMEFQFGTNWARFSQYAGGVIGTTLAMEGMFAFFLESTFLGIFIYGEKRLSPKAHLGSAVALLFGSWLSGYFIIATNAFMQHPVGYVKAADGRLVLSDFWAFLLNPWALWQYAHNMTASVVTAAFVVCGISAFWLLMGQHRETAERCLRVGVVTAAIACVLQLFPTGDQQGRLVANYQPVSLAAMEGLFESGPRAELALIGQPDVRRGRLENPIAVPGLLSFLAYGSFGSTVVGLNDVPHEQWPDNMEVTYYAYHVMVGLGTMFIALSLLSALQLYRGKLLQSSWLLWMWMLAIPFPYIANTAGWTTAEMARQPWIVYGLLRTAQGTSLQVGAGNAIFTFIGFCGLYLVVGLLFLYLVGREIAHGPVDGPRQPDSTSGRALGGVA
jgi:cytochrome bd ubiquinol oxidase subunit I